VNRKLIASCIDHTLLKPNAGFSDINQLCKEAHTIGFHSVCINPWLVKEAANNLKNSSVIICSVSGFPLGTNTTKVKLTEIETCLKDGASEIDMVMNIGFFKDRKLKAVANEFKEAKKMTADAILKIIIETSLLTKDEIVTACKTCYRM
jgi:deoxyribose-phosphate aldolase